MSARLKWRPIKTDPIKWIADHVPATSTLSKMFMGGKGSPTVVYRLLRAHLNHHILGYASGWVLPYWAERQLRVDSDFFRPSAPSALLDNEIIRNWVRIGSAADGRCAVVDPRGLVSPVELGFGLDFWLGIDDRLVCPSRMPSVIQSLYEASPVVETGFAVEGLRLRTWTWAAVAAGRPVVQGISVLKAKGGDKKVSLYLAIRPFNPEGVFPIDRIEYRPPCLLLIDGCAGLVLGREPHRVIAGSWKEGDLARPSEGKVEQAVESVPGAVCKRGLATMMVEYRLEGKGDGELRLSWAIPLERLQPGRKAEAGLVLLPESGKPEDAVRALGTPTAAIAAQDRLLTSAFRSTSARAGDLAWTVTPPLGFSDHHQIDPEIGLWCQEVLIRTGRFEEWLAGWRRLISLADRSGTFRGRPGRWDLTAMALRQAAGSLRRLPEQTVRLEILKPAVRLATALRSGPAASGEIKFYRDAIWSAAALGRVGGLFDDCELKAEAAACRETSARIWSAIDPWLTPDGEEAVPAGPDLPFRSDALRNLPALCLPDLPWSLDNRLKATIAGLKSLSVYEELLAVDGPAPAVSIRGSLIVALALVRLRLPSALDYVESILRMMTGTYNFPEAVDPSTGQGVSGDGHDLAADALLAVLIADLFLSEESRRLWITPAPALGWFAKDEKIAVDGLWTDFGRLDYRVDGLADRVVLSIKPEYQAIPERIRFTVPFYAKKALVDGAEVKMETRTLDFDPRSRKVVIYRESRSP